MNRIGETVDHVLQHLVVAGAMHGMVERGIAVHTHPAEAISFSISISAACIATRSSSVRRVAASSASRTSRKLSCFQHFRESGSSFHELVQHAAESTAATQEDAAAVAYFDKPLRLEHRQGLPHERAADLEP